ncbi:hypothetical protein EAH87_08040 [Sphingomonas koreensis]|nr:hypothetical protein EAH87_08040 [Sphingomonas koreensis]
MAGAGLGAIVAAAIAVSPALGFPGQVGDKAFAARPMTFGFDGGIGSFTPASADPRLAAALAKSGLGASGFRFTPSDSRGDGHHNVSIAVQARSSQVASNTPARAAAGADDSLRLAPIAYNLGVAVGWKRFALSGDMTHLDLAGQPGSRQAVDLGLSYTGKRLSGRVKVGEDKPLADTPMLIAEAPSQMIDVGGSYSLTRNLDVTAGVRYKSEQTRDRLQRLEDTRRDSQAVYIGTAFRF